MPAWTHRVHRPSRTDFAQSCNGLRKLGNLVDRVRRLTSMNLGVMAAVGALALGACSANGGELATPTTTTNLAAPEGTGASRAVDHVVAAGAAYEVTCAEPDVTRLGPEVLLDKADPRFGRAAELVDEDRSAVIALDAQGRVERCSDAQWVLAFGGRHTVDEPTATEVARLRCLVPAQPDDDRCAEGGPFWFGTDRSVDGTEGDGRSAVWIEGDAPEPPWRLDPLEVITREVGVDPAVPDFYRLRRIGLRVLNERPDEVLVEVLYQDITDNAGEPWGAEQREHHTVRKLPARQGWYPVTYIVARYAEGDTEGAGLDAAWAEGLDRVLVDVDRRGEGAP